MDDLCLYLLFNLWLKSTIESIIYAGFVIGSIISGFSTIEVMIHILVLLDQGSTPFLPFYRFLMLLYHSINDQILILIENLIVSTIIFFMVCILFQVFLLALFQCGHRSELDLLLEMHLSGPWINQFGCVCFQPQISTVIFAEVWK